MLHLGWVPLTPQTSNPPHTGLMNLQHVRTHTQGTNTRHKQNKQEALTSFEFLIVPNMSINHRGSLESSVAADGGVISRPVRTAAGSLIAEDLASCVAFLGLRRAREAPGHLL